MDWFQIGLRLVHVVFGVLWVGMMVFTVVFLTPAIRDAGQAGNAVMAAVERRGVMVVIPIVALGTLLSGMVLFRRLAGGASMALLHTSVGLTFALGGSSALVAFVAGLVVMRPAFARAARLADSLHSATTDDERATRMDQIQRLRARGIATGRVIALLLIVAASAMAVARSV